MTKFKISRDEIRVHGTAATVAERLSVPKHFAYQLLFDGDDWGFVIKICALVETALTDHLVRSINQPLLEEPFRFLNLNTKLEWANKLGGLTGERKAFADQLKRLRNILAHQIRKVPTFCLADHLNRLSPADYGTLTGGKKPKVEHTPGRDEDSGIDFSRYGIWVSALLVIADLEDNEQTTRAQREKAFQQRTNEVLAAQLLEEIGRSKP